MRNNDIDPLFAVNTIAATPNPQTLSYRALNQCYSEGNVSHSINLTEEECGKITVDRCLKVGHWSVVEPPQMSVNVVGFPHSIVQQITRHRHLQFSVQSGRYTGQRIVRMVTGNHDIEEVFYFRPLGHYTDRNGAKYEYTEKRRNLDKLQVLELSELFAKKIANGVSEEHAREILPYCVRQNFVMSGNLRALIHLLDIRAKQNAQPECQQMMELLLIQMQLWAPDIMEYYTSKRLGKTKLTA
jgi:thymidylate synthase (FAD)